jgi:hypothetical protein
MEGKVKKFLVLLCGILFVLGLSGSANSYILQDSTPFGGPYNHTYALFTFETSDIDHSWSGSQIYLQTTYGAYLATITSQEEQDYIASSFSGFTGEYWIGGFQDPITTTTATANWAWVTGEPWIYENWQPGEPNDNYGSGSEQFAAIWNDGGTWLWTWNDEGNVGGVAGFIGEMGDPVGVPEPATMLLLGCGLIGLAGLGRKKFFKK